MNANTLRDSTNYVSIFDDEDLDKFRIIKNKHDIPSHYFKCMFICSSLCIHKQSHFDVICISAKYFPRFFPTWFVWIQKNNEIDNSLKTNLFTFNDFFEFPFYSRYRHVRHFERLYLLLIIYFYDKNNCVFLCSYALCTQCSHSFAWIKMVCCCCCCFVVVLCV